MCLECRWDAKPEQPGRGSLAALLLPLGLRFPRRSGHGHQRQVFEKTGYSHNLIFVPAMNLKELKWFTLLKRMSSELGGAPNSPKPDLTDQKGSALSPSLCLFTARAGDQTSVAQSLPPPPRSQVKRGGAEHCACLLKMFFQEVRAPTG